jgi:HK97 family phage major capsid protein
MRARFSPFRSREDAVKSGRFFRAAGGDKDARAWCEKNGIILTRGQGEGVNSAGGYLVNVEGSDAIISIAERYGAFRQFAQPVTMAGDTKSQPRRAPVPTVYYPGESATLTETAALDYGSVALRAVWGATLMKTSWELGDDADADLAVELATGGGEALAKAEDDAGWNGDGTGSYGGQVGICTKLQAGVGVLAGAVDATSTHDTLAEIDATDLATLVGALPARALVGGTGAAWYCSQRAFALVFGRLAAAGGGMTIINGEPTYMTFPIRVSQSLPQVTTALNDQVMLLFGNLGKAAMFGTRRGIKIESSSAGTTWEARQTQWMVSERYHIVAHDLGTNSTPGAIVGLMGNT